MLTALDETFLHQAALTFDQSVVSDHRFFDRMWFGAHSQHNPAQNMLFFMGLAAYKNTNSFDGYFTFVKAGKQYNLRVARPFLENPGRAGAGPIDVIILKPLESLRILVAPGNTHSVSVDLTFSCSVPVSLEAPHQARVDGRVTQDYLRFDQMGLVNGWIDVDGERIEVKDWYAARDHSWGVRAGQGGYEPLTRVPLPGENPNDVGAGHDGFLVVVLWFDTPSLAGFLMQMEDGHGKILYSHGRLLRRENGGITETLARSITHELNFISGTRTSTGGTITVETNAGETIFICVESLLPTICYKGTGYDGGFDDERGLGFHRGTVLEADIYDVSHSEDVVLPSGEIVRPWHREGGAKVTINGEAGMAHFPCVSSGNIRRYGLNQPTINAATK